MDGNAHFHWHFINQLHSLGFPSQTRAGQAELALAAVCGIALACDLHWLQAAADPPSLTLLTQVQRCGGVKPGVHEGGGCWQKAQAAGHTGRLWQQEEGSQRWLKVMCWEVSELELSLLLQNKLLDWDPSCPSVLLFSLAVYFVALLPGTWLPASCCCCTSFWKMGISSACP